MSDGTSIVYILDPKTMQVVDKLDVCDSDGQVLLLNELEYSDGILYANVYQTDRIAMIDPLTGAVIAYVDCGNLLPAADRDANTDVFNGIAIRKGSSRLVVTGKRWPKAFEISLVPMK